MTAMNTAENIVTFPKLPRPLIPEIIFRHIDDAAFFWQQRNLKVHTPSAYPKEIDALDQRIKVHMNGIFAAGSAAWPIILEALALTCRASEIFVATSAALALTENEKHIQFLLNKITDAELLKSGFLSACAWYDKTRVYPVLKRMIASGSEQHSDIAIAACALRRIDPGESLLLRLESKDTLPLPKVLRDIGESGLTIYQPQLRAFLGHGQLHIQFWAARSLVLMGDRGQAFQFLCDIAENAQHSWQGRALMLVMRILPFDQALQLVSQVHKSGSQPRFEIIAACSELGAIETMDWLIQQMAVPDTAMIAGEAFTRITGLDLKENALHTERTPENNTSVNTENTESDQPLPDAEKVAQWWQTHQSEFKPGQRYLLGQPLDQTQLQYALNNGTQKIRHSAALELMLSGVHKRLFNIHQRN
jgi:uncharacterized protein (TIGR02270 family)